MQRTGCFAMRLAIILAVGTIALLIYGGNGIIKGIRYSRPVTLTYEQFLQQKPTAGWFHITGALMNVVDEVHIVDKDKHGSDNDPGVEDMTHAYLPVYNADTFPDGADNKSIHMLVYTGDPAVVATIKDMAGQVGNNVSKDQAEAFLEKNKDRLFLTRDVEGMVKSGLDSESSDVKNLLNTNIKELDPNYVILEEGAKPALGLGLGLFVLGLFLAAGQALYYVRNLIRR
ncbi:MAG TPA: hypothetical protein VKU00_27950 [Chthonomonadaceae bacterium]|nr:hypothetical protein [Chthonomonadaceae bacterium]